MMTWQVIMVKQGELCFAQFFENGATHVLTAGVQLVASFGTTTKSFGVKEDTMSFGTVPGLTHSAGPPTRHPMLSPD